MRDLYPRFFRSRRPPEAAAPETDGTAFEAQVRAAFPCPPVPDALQARVAELCRAAAAPEAKAQREAARSRRRWTRAVRWGSLGLAAVVLVMIALSSYRDVGYLRGAGQRMAALSGHTAMEPRTPPPALSQAPTKLGSADHSDLYILNRESNPGPPGGPVGGSMTAHRSGAQDADERFLASIPPGEFVGAAGALVAKSTPLTMPEDSRPDRYLIRNATLTLEVRDARQASRVLIAAVAAARGYVAESHESVDELGQRSVVITVRVPAGRFDGSLARIEALGKVLDKQVTAEDVTEEFVDSQARLANLQQTEARLRDHLGHAGRLSDILLVERELTRVRGQIEQLQGRLRYLAHRIAYSTLAVTLNEAPRPQPVVPPQGYSSGKVASDAMRSLVAFGETVCSGAIWLAVWAVVWLPLAVVAWLAYRRRVGGMWW